MSIPNNSRRLLYLKVTRNWLHRLTMLWSLYREVCYRITVVHCNTVPYKNIKFNFFTNLAWSVAWVLPLVVHKDVTLCSYYDERILKEFCCRLIGSTVTRLITSRTGKSVPTSTLEDELIFKCSFQVLQYSTHIWKRRTLDINVDCTFET